jgi:hypothetical protein
MKLVEAVILVRRIFRLSKDDRPVNAILRILLVMCSIVNMVIVSVQFMICKLFPGQENVEGILRKWRVVATLHYVFKGTGIIVSM